MSAIKGVGNLLWIILVSVIVTTAALPASAQVLINEVDSDTPFPPDPDDMEFVELYDGGVGNTALDGLVVVFFNGNTDESVAAFDLDGFTTDANGFFLMGNANVTPTPALVFADGVLQNGPDAVAVYTGDGTDFPNGTAVTTVNLVDAIVYDTNDPDDPDLLVLLNPGEPQVNEGAVGLPDVNSNQRCPDGAGGARNTFNYFQGSPTPGAANNCPAGPFGACCLVGGTCVINNATDCASIAGNYQGDGTVCNPNPCPNTGACCDMGTGTCTIRTQSECVGQMGGGVYLGDGVPCSPNPCPPDFTGVLINEIRIDMPGTDNDEYFELVNTSASTKSLTGLTYIVIGDGAGASGTVEAVIDLSGFSIPPGGHFLVTESTFTLLGATPDFITGLNFENSDNVTHMLVSGFSGFNGQDLDTDDNCILDVTPWIEVLDLVALIEADNQPGPMPPPLTECHYGSGNPFLDTLSDPPFVPGHVFRCGALPGSPCVDGSNTGFEDWFVGPFDPTEGDDTPGAPNERSKGACCTAVCLDDVERDDCEQVFSGVWLGRDTTCAMDGALCSGACCICDDPQNDCTMFTCVVTDSGSCVNQGGVFQGAASTCPPDANGVDCAECKTIAEARALPVGTGVRICDVVLSSKTDLINSLGSKNFQIQDTSGTDGQSALTVFGPNAEIDGQFGGAVEGDIIDIQGTINEFNGLLELTSGAAKPLALSRIDGPGVVPAPVAVTGADFQEGSLTAESLESEIVTLPCVVFIDTGTFEGNTNYTVSDGTDLVTVRISTTQQTDIIGQPIPTAEVSITGIFFQSDLTDPRDGFYQLLPRTIADFDLMPACGPTAACCLPGPICRDDLSESGCNALGGQFRPGDPTCPPAQACPDNLDTRITEIRIDQPGSDVDHYYELTGTPDTPLGDLRYIVLGDGVGGSGVIEEISSLGGLKVPADGVLLVAEDTYTLTAPSTVDRFTTLNFENGDNVTHMLVKNLDPMAAVGDDLDTDDDGVLDVTPWSAVVDKVAIIAEPNPPVTTEWHYGPPVVGPVGSTSPGHVALCPTVPPEWRIEAFDPAAGDDTPGSPNPAICGCAGCLGDMDLNAIIDARDIQAFISTLINATGDGCADVNLDGSVDDNDVGPFADRVLAQPPCGLGRAFGTRVVTWNLLGWNGAATSARRDAYKRVLNHIEPDILIAQEVEDTASANDFLNNILNAADGPGGYAMADFVDLAIESDTALYYKTDKITYTSGNFVALPTVLRNIMRWQVGHVGAGAEGDLIIYGAHLKAGSGQVNVDQRDAEATVMRNDADALPAGTQFLYAGDFNLKNANLDDSGNGNPAETAWATMTDVGADPDGQTFDPISAPGIWTANAVFSAIHTQSPHQDNADAPPGAANGGLDDRFDFILISAGLNDGVDLTQDVGSYRTFGNDGNHFNMDVNDPPTIPEGQFIADALHAASDHLPVILELDLITP